jgi:DNA (cytosine-5)-methyltransferase 1
MPDEIERIQGFPVDWTRIPSESSDEDVDSVRYHAVGNSVTPQVAEWLGKRVRVALAQETLEELVNANAAMEDLHHGRGVSRTVLIP